MLARTLLLGACAAALTAAQSAVLTFTRVPNPVTDGEPAVILYATNDTSSPVSILLKQGPPNNLQTVETLTSDATGGQYIWNPPKSLPNGIDYALEIRQAGQVNYFGPFTVQGASPGAVASASSAMSYGSSVTGSMTTMATMNATANATMTMTGTASAGTGMTMSRNTTMSSPTLSNTRTATMTGGGATDTGAGFQGTETSAAAPSSTGNAAASVVQGKSTVAFVLGALAAVVCVH